MKEASAKSRDSGVSVRSRASYGGGGDGGGDPAGVAEETGVSVGGGANGGGGGCADAAHDSDQESGYNSPRSGSHLYDLDPVVKASRKSLSPPKNHFVVSSAFSAKMNREDPNANYLPEYPLQRREPLPTSALIPATPSAPPLAAVAPPPPLPQVSGGQLHQCT